MPAYHQMGNNSENLVAEPELEDFTGIILSPVNREPDVLSRDVAKFREQGQFDVVFDPQLYLPKATRGKLPHQPYFPSDIESADLSSLDWWKQVGDQVTELSATLGVDTIASPTIDPQVPSADFYALVVDSGNHLSSSTSLRTLLTVMVTPSQVLEESSRMRYASILSRTKCDGLYLVFRWERDGRREIINRDEIVAALSFVQVLSQLGMQLLVGFVGTEVPLLRAAGATDCATGKFMNLRRYSRQRFDDPPKRPGGRQLPYFFSEPLHGLIREADVARLRATGRSSWLDSAYGTNPFSEEIVAQLDSKPGTPWLATSWRQFLWWFSKAADTADTASSVLALAEAQARWEELEDAGVKFDEPDNDGRWLLSWQAALGELD
ncbi:MAG: hypothetical protein AAF735_05420 [Myxococcota bacterium]